MSALQSPGNAVSIPAKALALIDIVVMKSKAGCLELQARQERACQAREPVGSKKPRAEGGAGQTRLPGRRIERDILHFMVAAT